MEEKARVDFPTAERRHCTHVHIASWTNTTFAYLCEGKSLSLVSEAEKRQTMSLEQPALTFYAASFNLVRQEIKVHLGVGHEM